MRGNWTSRTRQDLSFAFGKYMNCSADANVSNKLPKAFRIASSSSTIDTKKGLERVRVMAKIFSAALMKAEGYRRRGTQSITLSEGELTLLGRDPQPFGHAHQIRHGLNLHLAHDLSAMNFGGGFAGTQLRRNLFV